MANDARVDAYIDKSPDLMKPILIHMRQLVHKASPEIIETIKWGAPFFEYKGLIGGMAAFKQHCAFNFMKRQLMKDVKIFDGNNLEAKGHLGKIISVDDLPEDDVMIGYIREAMKLNEDNVKVEKKKPGIKKDLVYPEAMMKALKGNAKASEVFNKMAYTHQKEYVDWISEAKTEATRNKRIVTMLEWLEEGKSRNWKYQNC